MLPSVWPGDLLTIQSAPYDEFLPGDIVLLLRNRRFVIHRLVEKRLDENSLSWILRGDAMPHNDPAADAFEVLGKVTVIRRANRSFVPKRRISLPNRALAWMLRRWNPFRNLTLRIRAARLSGRGARGETFVRSIFGAVRGIPGISAPRTRLQR
jgi:hypothetical protein